MRTIMLSVLIALCVPAARAQFIHGALMQEEAVVSVTDTNATALWTFESETDTPAIDVLNGHELRECNGNWYWQDGTPKVGSYCVLQNDTTTMCLTNTPTDLQVQSSGNCSVAFWCDPVSTATGYAIANWDSGTNTRSKTVRNDTGTWKLQVSSDGTNTTATVGSTAATGNYDFVVAVIDDDNDLIKISVNGAAFETAAFTGHLYELTTPSTFCLGARMASGVPTGAIKARFDQVRYWNNYALSIGDVGYYYNGGSGR